MRSRSPLAAPRSRLAHVAGCVGWLRLPLVAARWILHREFLITARALDAGLPEVESVDGESWGPADDDDLEALLAFDPTLERAELARRFSDGQSCRVCRVDGEAAHWRWQAVAPAYLRYLGCALAPADGDWVVTEVLTRQDQRGHGVYARSAVRALHEAREAGYRRLVGFVAPWNRPAIQVMRGVSGRRVIGRLGYRSTWRGRRPFAEGAATVADDSSIRLLPAPPAGYSLPWP